MPVNGIPQNLQEMAVAQTQGAVQIFLDELPGKGRDVRETKSKARATAKDIIEAKNSKEAVRNLIQDLATKMATAGIKVGKQNFASKAEKSVKDEYDLMLQENQEDIGDHVEIRDRLQSVKSRKRTGSGMGGQAQDEQMAAEGKKDNLSQFTRLYAQYLVSGADEQKKKIDKLEQLLQEEGLSHQDVIKLEGTIRKSIRAEMSEQIKEAVLKTVLSQEKSTEHIINQGTLSKLIDTAFNSEKLGGWSFGGGNFKGNLQNVVDEAKREVGRELRDFIFEEMEDKFIRLKLGDCKPDEELAELVRVADKVGFDADEFIAAWNRKMDDLGLVSVNLPGNPMAAAQGNADQQGRGSQTGYEYSQDDEKELLLNQLRALFMQRALHGDLRTVITTALKMKKLKNGLIRLGVDFSEFEKVDQEGRQLAREKMREVLKEALVERASLYTLAGASFTLVEKKIKGAIKNLERLEVTLSRSEFEALRDEANRFMHDEALNELQKINIALEIEENDYLVSRQNQLVQLILRLREESGISTAIDPEVQMLFARQQTGSIAEAA